MQKNKSLLSGMLLIVGTCIGGGMLALPLATAAGGFAYTSLLLLLFWGVMTYSAFLILELSLMLPPHNNMISMAKATLGLGGEMISWVTYLLLLYCLLCAYISGGSDLIYGFLTHFNIDAPRWLSLFIFTAVFGSIIYKGIHIVDACNRFLMLTKLLAFCLLILSLLPGVQIQQLFLGKLSGVLGSVILIVTAYGYAVIIPSLCDYYNRDVKRLKRMLMIASLIPLSVYIIWELSVLGTLPRGGNQGLLAATSTQDPLTQLSRLLSENLRHEWIASIPRYFASVCILTSFLGVALSLSDFLADGLKRPKSGTNNLWIFGLTFLPPLSILLINPNIFIAGLMYAGIFTVVLLVLMPCFMVWHARYRKQLPSPFQVFGGKAGLFLQTALGFITLGIACFDIW